MREGRLRKPIGDNRLRHQITSVFVRDGAFDPGDTVPEAVAWLTRKFETDARKRWERRWDE